MIRYAVRNRDGSWFRAKGYGGYGDTWTADAAKARLYGKIGPARSIRTYFATRWPEHGVPELVKLEASPVVIDDAVHYEKARRKIATKNEEFESRQAQCRLERAQADFDRAQAALAAARAKS